MNTTFTLKTTLLAAALAVMPLAHSATMTRPDYQADKATCGSLAGNANDVCVKEAQAAETKALADAKLYKKAGEAQTEAADDKRDAAYKVAAEKCDALAGDAKASCISAAKLKFGKN
ncbi:MAG: cell envelope biogenesis protein TolA [Burkholderiales bacterium]